MTTVLIFTFLAGLEIGAGMIMSAVNHQDGRDSYHPYAMIIVGILTAFLALGVATL